MSASLSRLRSFYGELNPPLLLHAMIRREFSGSVAVLASHAEEAMNLLAMIAAMEPAVPVLWIDGGTGHDGAPEQLGFQHITHVGSEAELAELIEERAYLAIISAEQPAHHERFALDADGVFRIYPLAVQAAPAVADTGDWSV